MRTYLSTTSTHTSRFFLKIAPQGTVTPYGVLFKVSPGKEYTHTGSNLAQTRMQCSCYSTLYQQAKMTANNVIGLMEIWPNSASTTAVGVQSVFLDGERDLYEDDKNMHHVALDFIVWHSQ